MVDEDDNRSDSNGHYSEEDDEMGEAEDESNAKQITGTKCKRQVTSGDEGINPDADSSGSEEPELISSEEDPINSPAPKQKQQKKIQNKGPDFVPANTPKPVKSNLGLRRKVLSAHQREPSPATTVTSISEHSTTSSISSSSKGGKLCLRDLLPASSNLTSATKTLFRVWMATSDGFPDRTLSTQMAKQTYLEICDERQATAQKQRFQEDRSVSTQIIRLMLDCRSQLRNVLKNQAKGAVTTYYNLSGMNQLDVITTIKRLLDKATYIHREPLVEREKRAPGGVYRNPLIQQIISNQWFSKRNPEAQQHPIQFNPIPLETIALVCTAIHCILQDWEDGLYQGSKRSFDYDSYEPIYRHHIKSLKKLEGAKSSSVAKLQIELWEGSRAMMGGTAPGNNDSDDDYIDAEDLVDSD
ncbi:hypothetical protein FRC02_002498 [Tulasnella sp. 418]|nr:hypothetical protein FRC02_002498 [Tulasnella sp. 418]